MALKASLRNIFLRTPGKPPDAVRFKVFDQKWDIFGDMGRAVTNLPSATMFHDEFAANY